MISKSTRRARELDLSGSLREEQRDCEMNGDVWVVGYWNERASVFVHGYCRRR